MGLRQHFEIGKPKGIENFGEEINADIRFIGDGYTDQTWQYAMLKNKEKDGILFRPDWQNYFFRYSIMLRYTSIKLARSMQRG